MARPEKRTVDYFPHDAVPGKTIFILQSRFQNNGYAVWFKLLALLCRTPDQFFDCRKPADWQFLVAEMALTPPETQLILDCLAELEAIDPELWSHRIIWATNLMTRIADAYKDRKGILPVKPDINAISPPINLVSDSKTCEICGKPLIDMRSDAKCCSDDCRQRAHRVTDSVTDKNNNRDSQLDDNEVSSGDNPVSPPINSIKPPDNTQMKRKEMKRKEMKLKEMKLKESKEKTTTSSSDNDNFEPIKKDPGTRVTTETEFLEYVEGTKSEFPDLDCEVEFRRFKLWWSEGKKKLVRPKTAWHNWLVKAREIKQERSGNGTGRTGVKQYTDPEEYYRKAQADSGVARTSADES